MVFLLTDTNVDNISAKIRASIKSRAKPTDWRVTALLQKEIIGSIEGSSFWLQSTRPHFNGFPQRYFSGQIIDTPSSTIISGKFKFSKFLKVTTVITCVILSIISLALLLSEKGMLILAPLAGICFMLITPWLGIPFYRKDEKAVITFLETICKEGKGTVSRNPLQE